MRPLLLAATVTLALLAVRGPAAEYRIDRNHSNVGFAVPILGGLSKVRGKFADFAVELRFDPAALGTSAIVAVIRPASIDTGIADRDEHLRNPDFFDVARFPEARFASERIEATTDGFVAHGELTIRDIRRPLALPFRIVGRTEAADAQGKTEVLGFAAACTLNRRDFGMHWQHSVDRLFVGDEVEVEILLITRPRRL